MSRIKEEIILSECAKRRLRTIDHEPQYVSVTSRDFHCFEELIREGLVTASKPDKDNDILLDMSTKGNQYTSTKSWAKYIHEQYEKDYGGR